MVAFFLSSPLFADGWYDSAWPRRQEIVILDTVTDADLIIVISDGRIVESGRHDQLLAAEGEYSRLYSLLIEENKAGADQEPENQTV